MSHIVSQSPLAKGSYCFFLEGHAETGWSPWHLLHSCRYLHCALNLHTPLLQLLDQLLVCASWGWTVLQVGPACLLTMKPWYPLGPPPKWPTPRRYKTQLWPRIPWVCLPSPGGSSDCKLSKMATWIFWHGRQFCTCKLPSLYAFSGGREAMTIMYSIKHWAQVKKSGIGFRQSPCWLWESTISSSNI